MINVLVCSTDVECLLKFISLSRHVEETECEMHRKASTIGKHLVNYGVKKIYNFNNDVNFKIDENGKPYLEGCDIQFNISHSDSCVVAAFDKKPVGVDVENSNREIKNVNSLAKRIFTESEMLKFEKHGKSKQFLLRVWTQKEACLKLIGTGIKQGLQSVEINGNAVICNGKKYYLKTIDFNGYIISICSEKRISCKLNELKTLNI